MLPPYQKSYSIQNHVFVIAETFTQQARRPGNCISIDLILKMDFGSKFSLRSASLRLRLRLRRTSRSTGKAAANVKPKHFGEAVFKVPITFKVKADQEVLTEEY